MGKLLLLGVVNQKKVFKDNFKVLNKSKLKNDGVIIINR